MKKIYLNFFLSFIICLCCYSIHTMLIPNKIEDLTSMNPELINAVNSINSINKPILTLEDISLSNEKLKSILSNTSSELQSVKESLQNSSEIFSNKENLVLGIENNILFYNQLLAILNNPKGSDMKDSLNALMSYGEKTSSCYKTLHPITISFADNGKIFMENFKNNAFKEISSIQVKNNTLKSNKEFLNSFEVTTSNFFKLNKNYLSLIEKCRSKKLEFKEVLNDLDKTSKEIDSLSLNLYSITAPSDASNVFSSFIKILDSYSVYLKSVRQSLYTEMFASESLTEKEINDLYSSSNNQYKELETNIKSFNDEFNTYKNSMSN